MGSIYEDEPLKRRCKKYGVKKLAQSLGMHPKSLYAKLEGYVIWLAGEKEDIEKRLENVKP
jgi:hypothetical protein